jgi:hypothetical protein
VDTRPTNGGVAFLHNLGGERTFAGAARMKPMDRPAVQPVWPSAVMVAERILGDLSKTALFSHIL